MSAEARAGTRGVRLWFCVFPRAGTALGGAAEVPELVSLGAAAPGHFLEERLRGRAEHLGA